MSTYALFVPECHADTALMLTLLRENGESRAALRHFVSHQQGIGNVGRNMQKQPHDEGNVRRVLGLIDYDAKFNEQPYLSEFVLHSGGLDRRRDTHAILRHPVNRSQFLIALMPACDQWLVNRLADLKATPADFGLPADFAAFKAYCKTQEVERDPRLRKMLDAIATAYPPAYRALAEFVAQVMDLTRPV